MKKMTKIIEPLLWFVFGCLSIFLIWATIDVIFENGKPSVDIDYTNSYNTISSYGQLISSILSFISIILILYTIRKQKVENDYDRRQNKKSLKREKKKVELERFENQFYSLLQIHRDNYNEVQDFIENNDTFQELYEAFIKFGNETTNFYIYKNIELARILTDEVSEEEMQTEAVKHYIERIKDIYPDNIIQNASIHIRDVLVPYTILFFGVSNTGSPNGAKSVGLKLLKDYINSSVIDEIQLNLNSYLDSDVRGYHQVLGKYFRHLYNLVKFVDSSEALNSEEKMKYTKIIRSQLSDYEQIILFINSLTPLGEKWEIRGNNNFFSKYQLIKNIPREQILIDFNGDLDPKAIYPKIKFEDERF